MYVGQIDRLEGARRVVVLHNELFLWMFLERPFQKEAIAEVLSQWTLTQALCQPPSISHKTANSIAIVSAQPISRPRVFQPLSKRQAAQRSDMSKPMPQDDEASTQMSRSYSGSGMRDLEGFDMARAFFHQERSDRQDFGMWWRT